MWVPERDEAAAFNLDGDTIVVSRRALAQLSTLLHQVSNDLTISFSALTLAEAEAAESRLPAPDLLPAALHSLDRVLGAVGQLQGGLQQLQRAR